MMARTAICIECKIPAVKAYGSEVRPRIKAAAHLRYWVCPECGAYVGCHKPVGRYRKKPWVPLGHPASRSVRKLRKQVHQLMDPIWFSGEFEGDQQRQQRARRLLYRYLAANMGLALRDTHIGFFDAHKCLHARALIRKGTVEEFQHLILADVEPRKWFAERD